MQSDIPPLPISCLAEISITRTHHHSANKCFSPSSSQPPSSNVGNCCNHNLNPQNSQNPPTNPPQANNRSKKTFLQQPVRATFAGSSPYTRTTVSRFNLHQHLQAPQQSSESNNPFNPLPSKTNINNTIDKRVCSAKMLKIKQLQNQLADAHFHLNELSNENKLLKVIQKRQDAALKKYEGSNAELPRIINSHHEDYRVLEAKFKKLKAQHRETSDTLKDKESELHVLQMQNKKLLQLSKDRHLLERDKLQIQVSDLNHRISQQDDTIQTLKRKLSLETKYLKHQLHVEMVKHKESQKKLQDTETKLRNLEALMELREKRSRHHACCSLSHLHLANNSGGFSKNCRTSVTTQSLINLNADNLHKSGGRAADHNLSVKAPNSYRKKSEISPRTSSFPALGGSTPSTTTTSNHHRSSSKEPNQNQNQNQQIKKTHQSADATTSTNNHNQLKRTTSLQKSSTHRASLKDSPIEESLLEEIIDAQKLIDSASSDHASDHAVVNDLHQRKVAATVSNLTNSSRLLHARLISSATENNFNKKEPEHHNNGSNNYDRDSVVTVIPSTKKNAASRRHSNHHTDTTTTNTTTDTTNTNSNNISSPYDDDDNSPYDSESEIEVPMDHEQTDDEQLVRKSDVIIDQYEDDFNHQQQHRKIKSNSKSSPELNDHFDNFDNSTSTSEIDKLIEDKKSARRNSQNANDSPVSSSRGGESKSSKLDDSAKSPRSFDKAKLLAAMKAIDDNENIEFLDTSRKSSLRSSPENRFRLSTEDNNFYRALRRNTSGSLADDT